MGVDKSQPFFTGTDYIYTKWFESWIKKRKKRAQKLHISVERENMSHTFWIWKINEHLDVLCICIRLLNSRHKWEVKITAKNFLHSIISNEFWSLCVGDRDLVLLREFFH